MTTMRPPPALHLDVIIRCVMADVAVNEPLPRIARLPDDIVALAGSDVERVGVEARGRRPVSYTHLTLPTNREV